MRATSKLSNVLSCAVLCAVISLPSNISAHALFKPGSQTTPPRSDNLFNNLKASPCGGLAKSINPKVYKAGEEIKAEWVETIDHPGSYRISFSKAGDANFKPFGNDMPDMKNGNLQSGQVYENSTMITLPSMVCDDCSLQLIQVMTENPTNPTYYYSCSDIKLVADANDVTAPSNIALPRTSSAATQIQLQWDNPLSDFNSVLVLQNTSAFTDTLDAPLDSVSYGTGDVIGTSKVIYVGENDAFTDVGLDQSTQYYYKFFTFDLNRNYANGLAIDATTSGLQPLTPPDIGGGDNGVTGGTAQPTNNDGGGGSLGFFFLIISLMPFMRRRKLSA